MKHSWRTDKHEVIEDSFWVTGFRIQTCRLCGVQRGQFNNKKSASSPYKYSDKKIVDGPGWNDRWYNKNNGHEWDGREIAPECTGVLQTQPNILAQGYMGDKWLWNYPNPYA